MPDALLEVRALDAGYGDFQAQIGASLPLVRDRYLFAPDVELHQTPAVTGWLVVGAGLRFP